MTAARPTLLLSVDFEDWHQLVRRRVGASDWESPGRRSTRQTDALLDLLDELDARATFFVLGMAARAHPELLDADRRRRPRDRLPRRRPSARAHADPGRVRRGPARRARDDRGPDRPHARRLPRARVLDHAGAARTGPTGSWPKRASPTTRASTTRRRCVTGSSRRRPARTASRSADGGLWEFPVAVWRIGRLGGTDPRRRRVVLAGAADRRWSCEGLGRGGPARRPVPAPERARPRAAARAAPERRRTARQRAHAKLREVQRNGARRRAPGVLRAIARDFELIPYGEAHARLNGSA